MAWTYFTDWLSDGQMLTWRQSDELYDAFDWRVLAIGLDARKPIDLVTRGWRPSGALQTSMGADTIGITIDNSDFLGPLANAIRLISVYYHDPDTFDPYSAANNSPNNILRLAAYDLGISEEQFFPNFYQNLIGPMQVGYQHHHMRWNVIRRAIQLLRCVRLNTNQGNKASGWQVSPNVAETEFLDGTETESSTSIVSINSQKIQFQDQYQLSGSRVKYQVRESSPSFPTLSFNAIVHGLVVHVSGVRWVENALYFHNRFQTIPFVDTGPYTFENPVPDHNQSPDDEYGVMFAGYDERNYLANYAVTDNAPDARSYFRLWQAGENYGVYLRPVFPQPYEPMS